MSRSFQPRHEPPGHSFQPFYEAPSDHSYNDSYDYHPARPAHLSASESIFALGLPAAVPSEPLLYKSSGHAHFGTNGYGTGRASLTLRKQRPHVGGVHAFQGLVPAAPLFSVAAPSALLVRKSVPCHLASGKVGTRIMMRAK